MSPFKIMERRIALRNLINRSVAVLAETPNPAVRKRLADVHIGRWLSAALESDQVANQFRGDIHEWFAATEQLETATKLAHLLSIAQKELKGVIQPRREICCGSHFDTCEDCPQADERY